VTFNFSKVKNFKKGFSKSSHFCAVKKIFLFFFFLFFSFNVPAESLAEDSAVLKTQSPFQETLLKQNLFADNRDTSLFKVYVKNIVIEGNRKTKERIILRALTFASGDSIPFNDLKTAMEVSKYQLIKWAKTV
jgi:hypothetical protein